MSAGSPSAQERIAALRAEIRRHDQLYYIENRPEISDAQYDALMRALHALESQHPELVTPDSPTQRVGERPLEGFTHVRHAIPMLSIDNTYSPAELREFDQRVRKGLGGEPYEYVVDPKIDGVAVALRYEDGVLAAGATRGDGETGDEITQNLRTIRSIPLRLAGAGWPRVLEVRGEVYWPRPDFDAANRRRAAAGEPAFANPRNATAGTLKQLDARNVAGRGLAFCAHGFGLIKPFPSGAGTHLELFARLRQWGIPTSPHLRRCGDIEAVIAFVHEWDRQRHGLDYQTDGLVIKLDRLEQRERLGATAKAPRWCIAYKFAAEQAHSRLLSVDFQVGKQGTITPVANLEPVQLSGTTVRRATLHNFDQVRRLDLHVGDLVTVEKAGEIIPQVVGVVVAKRPEGARPIEFPTACPSCGTALIREPLKPRMTAFWCVNPECELYLQRRQRISAPVRCRMKPKAGEKVGRGCDASVEVVDSMPGLLCPNEQCPARLAERLRVFCGRDQMDVEGVGEQLADSLVHSGLVRTLPDLYRLAAHRDELARIRFAMGDESSEAVELGELRADRLLQAIERSKSQPLSRLLAALCINHVGLTTAEEVADGFGNMERLFSASEKEIGEALARTGEVETTSRDAVGRQLAERISAYFSSAEGKEALGHIPDGASLTNQLSDLKIPQPALRRLSKNRRIKLLRRFPDLPSLMHATKADLRTALFGTSGVPTPEELWERLHSGEGSSEFGAGEDLRGQLTSMTFPREQPRGIPKKRQLALSRHFDSLKSLAKASIEELELALQVRAEDARAHTLREFFDSAAGRHALTQVRKDLPLGSQIEGLGIPSIKGRALARLAELLEDRFTDMDSLAAASEEEIAEALGMTRAVPGAVYSFFHREGGDSVVADLRAVGVNMEQPGTRMGPDVGPLAGKTIVVTGTLARYSRGEVEDVIKRHGGKPTGTVNKKTDFVVAGENPGSKLDKARAMGVPVLSEQEFERLIEGE